ncbi:MAG: hypothetical protein Q9202_006877 [Teloschistes flavicans]
MAGTMSHLLGPENLCDSEPDFSDGYNFDSDDPEVSETVRKSYRKSFKGKTNAIMRSFRAASGVLPGSKETDRLLSGSKETGGQGRPSLTLVYHGNDHDITALNAIGFSFERHFDVALIVDTSSQYSILEQKDPMNPQSQWKLGALVDIYGLAKQETHSVLDRVRHGRSKVWKMVTKVDFHGAHGKTMIPSTNESVVTKYTVAVNDADLTLQVCFAMCCDPSISSRSDTMKVIHNLTEEIQDSKETGPAALRPHVVIAVDMEGPMPMERGPHYIRQVGLAISHFEALRSVNPGPRGQAWSPFIKTAQFQLKSKIGQRPSRCMYEYEGGPLRNDCQRYIFEDPSELCDQLNECITGIIASAYGMFPPAKATESSTLDVPDRAISPKPLMADASGIEATIPPAKATESAILDVLDRAISPKPSMAEASGREATIPPAEATESDSDEDEFDPLAVDIDASPLFGLHPADYKETLSALCPSHLLGVPCIFANHATLCSRIHMCKDFQHGKCSIIGPLCSNGRHVMRTCRSITKGEACTTDNCRFGHDYPEIRRELQRVRKMQARMGQILAEDSKLSQQGKRKWAQEKEDKKPEGSRKRKRKGKSARNAQKTPGYAPGAAL